MSKVHYKPNRALVWQNAVQDVALKHGSIEIPTSDYVCYVGRLSYQKNPLFLLDVIAKVRLKRPDIKFYILGVGFHSPDLEGLKKRMEQLSLTNNVVLIPWLSQ
jgi:glycosyltransferase involved in cell wall biosynthesis